MRFVWNELTRSLVSSTTEPPLGFSGGDESEEELKAGLDALTWPSAVAGNVDISRSADDVIHPNRSNVYANFNRPK